MLDGIRGVAALCIVILHAYRYFGDLLPSGQMAVDLFFVLSGFVLAHAYDARFRRGLSPLRFICMRYVRLYPLYLLGISLGLIEALLYLHYHEGAISWTASKLAATLPFAALMVPTPFGAGLYPLDGVMWSIFFELVANLTWAVLWWRLRSTRTLVALIAVSGIALTCAAYRWDTMALGVGWHTFLGGLARVMYSFMFGVLLHRFHGSVRVPRVSPVVLLIILPLLMAFRLDTLTQLCCALFVFPFLVLLGTRVEPTGVARFVCAELGRSSYAVYALHSRLYRLGYAALLQLVGFRAERYVPWTGVAFLCLLVPGCALLTQMVETPARRKLSRLLGLVPDRRPAVRA